MTPVETLNAYVRAFETLDAAQFASYYHLPCQFITPAGVFAITDDTALQSMLAFAVQQAREQGYQRTETVGDIQTRMLAADVALLSGVYRRLDAKNQEITRFGFSYTLRRGANGWQIVSAIIHDPLTD